ncbi:AAA family ATPase [Thalassobacillus sp. CUG 92003]|uniref:AAA family ATPase n=1 Tax=Thalassobacillus sp. CUG 92003 TaxID=2736641 RepID=UPI002104CEE3|nr:AAA family ATPase [Thalassobacillus sp. CUG 92003]
MTAHVNHSKQGKINIILNDMSSFSTPVSGGVQSTQTDWHRFKRIEDYFANFIGMDSVKEHVKEIYAQLLVTKRREQAGLNGRKQVLHMLFKGNPGTGKTTVARMLATLFHDMEILEKGHFIEADRSELVGEYIGHTAQKTKDLITKALGGVLFIDEAYSLARGGEKDFGKEAIDTIVKCMEDHHDEFVLILAGYPHEMTRFMALNPGLESRFPLQLSFPDYNASELIEIADFMVKEREYKLSRDAMRKLHHYFQNRLSFSPHNFSNGRLVRNVIEHAIRKQAMRIVGIETPSLDQLMTLEAKDFMLSD